MSMLERVAKVIVDRRNLLFLFYIIAVIFSLFSMQWVNVENDITYYLDENSKTRQGITLMDEEFTTFAMGDVMVANISFKHAQEIADRISEVPGVAQVMFEHTDAFYKNSSALFVVLFGGEAMDTITLDAMADIKEIVQPYDSAIASEVGVDLVAQLAKDMMLIGVLAAIVVVIVLTFTSQSYAEIPILLVTFGVAALLNMGTNFMLGKISFISNSVGAVLQLALAIDYAIILVHRFREESELLPPREAAIMALSKAIPEISSSSLTTMAGLAALAFMQFGVGKDLAAVMIKAILFSMLAVFTLMPGLLVTFSGVLKRTEHRNFVPSVKALGRFSLKAKYIIPPVFVVLLVFSFYFSNKCPYLFGMSGIRANRVSEAQLAEDRIRANFGAQNMVALIVPSGNYGTEKKLLTALGSYDEVEAVAGLANTEAMGGYMLADALTPRQFAELIDLDFEVAQLLYSIYAINDEDYGSVIGGISRYGVPLIDMVQFLFEQVDKGTVPLNNDMMGDLDGYDDLLDTARKQMEGTNYSRLILYLNLPEEGQETYDFLATIYTEAEKYYDADSVFAVGGSTNALDLSAAFVTDNLVISILSVLFVVIVLTFTFQSVGLPFILISVIQASIWINFSFPFLRNQGLYFLGFLLVSSIQMGANIDYAIVITSRYTALKQEMPPKEAIVEALDQSFPTVITSGTILAIAGLLIGQISTDGATAILGSYLGQGTIISVILVLFVLPMLLYLGDGIIERTSFKIKMPNQSFRAIGNSLLNAAEDAQKTSTKEMEDGANEES